MAGNIQERGFIKTAFVRIAPTRDTSFKASRSKYFRKGGTQFFFNSKDSGFISFSHSIGWSKGALTQYKLEVVDPGDDFEQEFIATHYFNRNANSDHITKSYFISYGVGKFDEVAWENGDLQQGVSMAQLAYLIKIDVVVGGSGARKYILLFGSLPSLRNNPSSEGWPVVDQGGRMLLTAGRAGFKLSDVKAELKKPRLRTGTRGFGFWTEGNYQKDPMVENWVRFLDEGVNLSIKRYIENITGLGPNTNQGGSASIGNVIVLMPSFRHTTLVETMNLILNAEGTHTKLITHTCDVINTKLFNEFPNLEAYNLRDPEQAKKMNQHSTSYKQEWRTSLRKDSDGVIVFKAVEGDFKKDTKTKKEISIDWMNVLTKFGNKLGDNSFSLVKLKGTYRGLASPEIDIPLSYSSFGTYDYVEIKDKKRLKILKEHGLIGRLNDYCLLWGEINMMRLFLGQLPNDETMRKLQPDKWSRSTSVGGTIAMIQGPLHRTEYYVKGSDYYSQIKGLFPKDQSDVAFLNARIKESTEHLPNAKKKVTQWLDELNPNMANVGNDLANIIAFVNNDDAQIAMGDSAFYSKFDDVARGEVLTAVSGVIKGSTATVAEIGRGNYVPILRSNVRNANVIDLRLMMNPHYWGDLAGIVEDMTPYYNKLDEEWSKSDAGQEWQQAGWDKDILDGLLKEAGIDKKDPRWKAWISDVKRALWPILRKTVESKDMDLSDLKSPALLPEIQKHIMDQAGPFPSGLKGPGPTDNLLAHILSNFVVFDRGIISRPGAGQDILRQSYLFYERLYSKAGPQMDVTTYPMFMYSRYSDLGQGMWVEMRQPNIMKGIKPKMDVLALDKKYESQNLELGTGMYFIKAFEHTIDSNNVKSRFRLHKNPTSPK